jgi:hypothetical protein
MHVAQLQPILYGSVKKLSKSIQRFRRNCKETKFYVVHTLPMSYFCIYPHSGIPQGLRGLILVKNPLREPWSKILPSGGAPLPPSLRHVTSTTIDQYPSVWKKFHTHRVFFPQVSSLAPARSTEGLPRNRHPAAGDPRTRLIYPF